MIPAQRVRIQRRLIRLYPAGPRPIGETVLRIAEAYGAEDELERLLSEYDRYHPEWLRDEGLGHFPPHRLLEVPPELLRRAVP